MQPVQPRLFTWSTSIRPAPAVPTNAACPRSAARIRPVPLKVSLRVDVGAVPQRELEELEIPSLVAIRKALCCGVVLGR